MITTWKMEEEAQSMRLETRMSKEKWREMRMFSASVFLGTV